MPRGVIRYFDVLDDPPRRGRPRLETTLELDEVIAGIAARFDLPEGSIDWAEPES